MGTDGFIDLRSDTVTTPTPDMRHAISNAAVGDDYYGDDPTVRKLEEKAADRLGKEAALLVLSGTMGNLVALMALTPPGQSIILGEGCHILVNEAGGLARLGGLTARVISAPRGVMTAEAVQAAILSSSPLNPLTSLLCLENTNNAAGGAVVPVDAVDSLCATAHERGLKVHMDGARIFNAQIALNTPVARIVQNVDTVTFCLTKGLACPAGAIVAGTADFIAEARRCRQCLGGGMRQAGIFAAAGIVALEKMIDRLAEDHDNARLLADILIQGKLPMLVEPVDTNMVYVALSSDNAARHFVDEMKHVGVLLNPPKGRRVRMVTHIGISRSDIKEAATAIIRSLRTVERVE